MSGRNGSSSHQQNVELMREIGSTKGYDPMPPDQYLTYQNKRYPPKLRLWAWMLSKTIRQGHRSAYAVEEHGKGLTIQHGAADLDMDEGDVRRA
jgi:hypothetical protein